MDNEKPNYYAIIPAEVRYAKISPNAKLLYGELTALSNKEGYCWASNEYFADLYETSNRSISRWIGELKDCDFINYEVEENYKRKIFINNLRQNCLGGTTKLSRGYDKNVVGVGQNCPHNNTSNNTKNITKNYIAEDIFLTEILYKNVDQNYPELADKRTELKKEKDYEEMNRLRRLDKWNTDQIKLIINWSQNDSFWKMNIRSVKKLRKQFNNLVVRAKDNQNKINVEI